MRFGRNNSKNRFIKGNARELPQAFPWQEGPFSRFRMVAALLLASLVTILLGTFLRVTVPSQIQDDGPFLDSVKMIPVTAKSDPSLLRLLEKGNVPSLGSDEILLETPLSDDLLAQIGLANEKSPKLRLVEAPVTDLEQPWPLRESGELVLPKAPPVEMPVPLLSAEAQQWFVRLEAADDASQPFLPDAKAFRWDGEVPLDVETDFTLVIGSEGGLVLALPNEEMEAAIALQVRNLLQRWVSGSAGSSAIQEMTLQVSVRFESAENSLP